MAKVSIIVPIYNVEKYINECIESIQNQTLKDIEIILVDDGSTDESAKMIEKYAKEDSRIVVIHKENGGVTSARKVGINVVSSPYVCFVDGDDYIKKDMCEQLYIIAEKEKVEAVFSQKVYRVYEDKCEVLNGYLKEGIYRNNDGSIEYVKNNIWNYKKRNGVLPFMWCNLYQTAKAKKILMQVPNDITFSEDGTYIYMFLAVSKDICIINKPYYYYRMRMGSAVESIDKTFLLNIAKRYLVTCNFFEQNNINKTLYRQLKYNIFEEFLTHFFKREGMSSFLFPYEKIETGKRIVLYAAGNVGKSYYKQIKENKYCNIVLWVDTNFKEREMENVEIESPDQIKNVQFDYVLIAILNESVARGIKARLINDYNINSYKIVTHVPKSFFDLLD